MPTQNKFLKSESLHFIGGEWTKSLDGKTFADVNPATGEVLSRIASGSAAEIDAAANAAENAWLNSDWRHLGFKERATWLRKIADALEENLHELAILESLDTGKPLSETSTGDIPRAIYNFRYFADEVENFSGQKSFSGADKSKHTTFYESLGVVGLITPWNLPLYLESWKIAPALAMGNAIILKPAELTPLTASAFAEILQSINFPSGIFNVVHGFGAQSAGEALVRHPKVGAISFTGETTTGTAITQASASLLKKLSFELGGKGASVIFADADLSQAVPTSARAAFRNQGQICLAGSRLLVEEGVADKVVEGLKKHVEAIKIGDPLDPSTTMGALISTEHRQKVLGFIEHAKKENCKIECGGKIPEKLSSNGAYLEPTIISKVAQNSKLIQEEIFGPVLTVQTFKGREEALSLLNGTPYGLSCSIWSKSDDTLNWMSSRARFGLVWQNSWFLRHLGSAFGGMKRSGVGREGGAWSFEFFSEKKTISSPAN